MKNKSKILFSFSLLSVLSLASCTSSKGVNPQQSLATLAQEAGSGSVLISRRAPSISNDIMVARNTTTDTSTVLGFMPVSSPDITKRVTTENEYTISKQKKVISFLDKADNGKTVGLRSIKVKNIAPKLTGKSPVALKVNKPTWYAPDSYYEKRSLPVPQNGSKERFLKGALGNQAIFLESGEAIHDSKIWSEEVGGIRVSKSIMDILFPSIKLGEFINIKD